MHPTSSPRPPRATARRRGACGEDARERLPLVVRVMERVLERFGCVCKRERVVAGEVRVSREEVQNLADAEVRRVDLREHLREAEGVRRHAMPGVVRNRGVETHETRERIAVVREELQELRLARPAFVVRTRVVLDACDEPLYRPAPFARSDPTQSARRCVRSAPVPGVVSDGSTSSSRKSSRSIWNATSWRMKSGLSDPSPRK